MSPAAPLLLALLVQGRSGTQDHLLRGVRLFREGRYADALIELRVVEKSRDAPRDLAFYLGPTLYKLGRFEEALRVFLAPAAPHDALTDFYLAETYYQLRLYRKAREIFGDLRARGLGPRLAEAAGRYVAEVDRIYAAPPPPAAVDAYLEQGRAVLSRGDAILAAEILDEAQRVEALGAHRHRTREIALARAQARALLSGPR